VKERVSFLKADAARLPFEAASFDPAISTQVYEYVQDIDLALAEL
jgi:ubiquinone/menaquinone biosynthesis C-methylase UbiE